MLTQAQSFCKIEITHVGGQQAAAGGVGPGRSLLHACPGSWPEPR